MTIELEEGDVVLCTVDRIVGTIVFVKIDGGGEGSIILSEIAPGRIRNLRDYVVPNKKIVCKVLSIKDQGVSLSFRRVKQHERKELLSKITKEKGYKAILKTVIGEKANEIIKKITKDYSLLDFFELIKSNPKPLEKFIGPTDSKKIIKMLE